MFRKFHKVSGRCAGKKAIFLLASNYTQSLYTATSASTRTSFPPDREEMVYKKQLTGIYPGKKKNSTVTRQINALLYLMPTDDVIKMPYLIPLNFRGPFISAPLYFVLLIFTHP